MKIGSHVSNNGTLMLEGSVKEALSYNANAFMIYLGAPQNSYRKPLSLLRIEEMHKIMYENNIPFDNVIVHAPYIVNLANPDSEKRDYGIRFIANELIGTAKLKARCLVLHPGAHMGGGSKQGVEYIVQSLKKVLELTKDYDSVIAVETMSGKGSEVGVTFEEISEIIKGVNSPRVKVCLDTCHIHDGGYDIVNNYEEVISEFERIVGLENIVVLHINDSKNICGAHKDRHANIGFGEIGFQTLAKFIHDDRFKDIPKILETPYVKVGDNEFPPYKQEIAMLLEDKFDEDLINNICK